MNSCLKFSQGKGFQALIEFLEPGYKIPARKTVTGAIEKMHEKCNEETKRLLQDHDIALTTDNWTSIATGNFKNLLKFASCYWIHLKLDYEIQS